MRSILVIGAGRFGSNLAIKLTELGNEVLIVDINEDKINKISPFVTRAQIGDCVDREVLEELGVRNFDVCFVCISQNFQSSMEISSMLKELGAVSVVAKSDSDMHEDLLKKIGADFVVCPERDMAQRTAARFSAHGAFDYVELSPEYAIMEILPPSAWVGNSIRNLNIRNRNNINIVGIRVGAHINPVVTADYEFTGNEHVLIAGEQKNIMKLVD